MNSSRFNHARVFNLGLVLLGWTLFGFFFASQNYVRQAYDGRNPNFQRDLGVWLTCGYSWAILTYPILLLARRFPFSRDSWRRSLAVHIPASLFFAIAELTIFSIIRALLGNPYSADRFQNLVVENIHSSVLIYFGILAVRQVLGYLIGPDSSHTPRPLISQGVTPPDSKLPRDGETEIAAVDEGPVPRFTERFSVKKGNRIVFINAEHVTSITSEGNYVKIRSNGESYMLRETMKAMERKLDPNEFIRVRRSTIVRIEQIQELRPISNSEFEVVLKNGAKVSSSRRYRKNFDPILKA